MSWQAENFAEDGKNIQTFNQSVKPIGEKGMKEASWPGHERWERLSIGNHRVVKGGIGVAGCSSGLKTYLG